MSLTGLPLLAVSAFVAVTLVVASVLLWSRTGRARVVVRCTAIVACEASLLWVAGLAVNRSLDLYPSWSALVAAVPPAVGGDDRPTANLEQWLAGKAAQGRRDGFAFDWTPDEERGWGLSAAPSVYVPPSYFTESTVRFPVVVVVAAKNATPARAGWSDRATAALARDAVTSGTPAVVVFVRADQATAIAGLATTIPARLEQDLRVTSVGWELVAVGPASLPALDVIGHAGNRYRGIALLADGATAPPGPVVAATRALPAGTGRLFVAASRVVAGEPDAGYPTASKALPRPQDRLVAALRWCDGLLPAPLAPPLTAGSVATTGPAAGR